MKFEEINDYGFIMIYELISNSRNKVLHIKLFGNAYLPFYLETKSDNVLIGEIKTPQMLCAACCDAPYDFAQDKWATDTFNGIKGISNNYVCSWQIRSYRALDKYLEFMEKAACLWSSISIVNKYWYPENSNYKKRVITYKFKSSFGKEIYLSIMDKASDSQLCIKGTNVGILKQYIPNDHINKGDVNDFKNMLDVKLIHKIIETEIETYYSDIAFELSNNKYSMYLPFYEFINI